MDYALQLGQKIKDYRTRQNLTIKELATQADITSSMLSQIERGQANPSLNTIRLLSKALHEPMYLFFVGNTDLENNVVRKQDRKQIVDAGLVYELLSPDTDGSIEMTQLTLKPDAASCKEPIGHKGEEVVLVVEGTAEVQVEDSTYTLHAGDSIRVKGETKHRWRNPGAEPAILLFAVTPPSF